MHKPKGSLRKVFAAGLAISTALWTFTGLFVLVAQAVEAHPGGTLVLSSGTVWKVSDDGSSRMGFDSAEKFFSHRYDFADVVPANSADLALPDGGLVSWGSGVLFNDAGTVFQVAGGMKHGFTSAANFTGNGYSWSNVVSGSLSSLSAGANVDNTTGAHLEGTWVNDGGTVYMVTATGKKGVPEPGVFFSYGAGWEDLVPANSADQSLANEGNLSYRSGSLVNDGGTVWAVSNGTKRGFPSASCFTGFGFSFGMLLAGSTTGVTTGSNYCADTETPPVTSNGTLTVTKASDTPATGIVVENAARVGFTKVNLTATGGDVTVDSMTVERQGIAADAAFSEIILLDVSNGTSVAQAAQLGNEKSLGSTHQAVFNDDLVVKNGTTKSILVAANMAGTLNAGQVAQLALVDLKVVGSANTSMSLPIVGNGMTLEGNIAIATVTVAAGGSNPSASTQNVGTTDYIVSSIKVTAGSQEDIEISSLSFYENGTAADSDVANLELLVDGVVVGTVAAPVSKKAQFVFSSPIKITKGNNKDFNLRLDIVDGSSRTISMDIDKKVDLVARGLTYGYFRVPTYPNSSSPYYNAPDTTINSGSITFSKGVLASLNVAEGASTQALGAVKVTVQGEPVQVTQFVVGVSVTGTGNAQDVSNLTIKDASGNVVGGPVDPDTNVAARDTATSTDTIIFPVGTNTYTIYGDLNSDFAGNDTVQLDLADPDGLVTAKGTVTNNTITASPTSGLSLDTVTVKAGSLNVSTSVEPAAQSVIVGASQFTFANYVLDATASGEDVRVTQVAVQHNTSNNSIQTNIINLTLYDGATALSPIKQPAAAAATTATTTFSLTNAVVVEKGTSKTLTLKGDLSTGTANHTHAFGCVGTGCITATGATTGNTITPTVTASNGQAMTIATSGTLEVSDGTHPDAALIVGGSSKVSVAEINFLAKDEDVDMQGIFLTANAVNGGALNDEFSMVYLFDGSTQVASAVPTTTGSITFSNLDGKFKLTKGETKKMTVKVDVRNVTNNSGDGNSADSGDGISFSVGQDEYTAKGMQSGSALAAANRSGTVTGNQFTVYKSVPTWAKLDIAGSGTGLTNSSGVPLFRFSLAADAKGDIGFYNASFQITTSTATVTQFELYESSSSSMSSATKLSNTALNISRIVGASSGGIGGVYAIDVLIDTSTLGVGTAQGGDYRTISAGTTKYYELRGTVANSAANSQVSVAMLGDEAFSSTHPDRANDMEGQYDFIWSDLHYGNSTSTATQTLEWYNGFRVNGMGDTMTTSTAQVTAR